MRDVNRNMGDYDRQLRVMFSFVVGILFIFYVIHSWWGDILFYLALYGLITSILAFDPIYYFRKHSTKFPDDGFR